MVTPSRFTCSNQMASTNKPLKFSVHGISKRIFQVPRSEKGNTLYDWGKMSDDEEDSLASDDESELGEETAMQQPLDLQQIRHEQRRLSVLLAAARNEHAPPLYESGTRKTRKIPEDDDQYQDAGDIAETALRNRYTQRNYKKYLDKLNLAQLRHSYDESVVQSIRRGKMEVAHLQNQLLSRSLGSMDKEVQLVASRRNSIVKSQLSLSSSMSTGRAPTISERTIYIPSGQEEEEDTFEPPLVRYQHGDIGAGKNLNVKLSEEEFEEWKRKHGALDSLDNTPVATPGERRAWGMQRDSDSRRGRGLGSRGAGSRGRGMGLGGIAETGDLTDREGRGELDELEKSMLVYNRHGMTDSAMQQYKLKELERQRQAARRKRGGQGPGESGYAGSTAGEDEDEWEKEERRRREEEREYARYATKHSKMEMHRQAYIKALANARMRKLPREPWELATKTTRAYTFSYVNHRPTCRCEKCLQRKPRDKKEKAIPGMKLIFGEINMYDFYPKKKRKNAPKSPPPWIRERALQHSLSMMGIRHDRKKRENEVTKEPQRPGMGAGYEQTGDPQVHTSQQVQQVTDHANRGGLVTKSFMTIQPENVQPAKPVQQKGGVTSQAKVLAYNTPLSRTNSISNSKRHPLPELTKGRYVSLSTEATDVET